jgi:hypothetical protein
MRRFDDGGMAVRALAAVGLAAFLAIGGCASMAPGIGKDSPSEEKQKVVANRAVARWEALIKGDLDTAYTFLSAGSRAAYPLDLYKRRIKPGLWRTVRSDKVACEAELCKVDLIVTIDAKRMKGLEVPLTETWIIEDGNAWFVYR